MTRAPVSLAAAGGVACASTIFGLFALPGPAAPERAFVVLLTGLAWLGVARALAVAAGQVRGIVDEQRVLGARVSPRPHWAAQRRASLGVITSSMNRMFAGLPQPERIAAPPASEKDAAQLERPAREE